MLAPWELTYGPIYIVSLIILSIANRANWSIPIAKKTDTWLPPHRPISNRAQDYEAQTRISGYYSLVCASRSFQWEESEGKSPGQA